MGVSATYIASAVGHLLVDVVVSEDFVHWKKRNISGSRERFRGKYILSYLCGAHQGYCDGCRLLGRDRVRPLSTSGG